MEQDRKPDYSDGGIGPVPSRDGQVLDVDEKAIQHDAVFGTITTDGPNYRDVSHPSSLTPLFY